MLTTRKPKVETTTTEPLPSEHNMDTVYLEGTHTVVHVSSAITGRSHCAYPDTEISLHLDVPFIVHFYSRTVGIAIYNIQILLAYDACAAWPITFGQIIFLLSFSLSPSIYLFDYRE